LAVGGWRSAPGSRLAYGGGAGDFHGVAQGRGPSYCECGLEAGIVIR